MEMILRSTPIDFAARDLRIISFASRHDISVPIEIAWPRFPRRNGSQNSTAPAAPITLFFQRVIRSLPRSTSTISGADRQQFVFNAGDFQQCGSDVSSVFQPR